MNFTVSEENRQHTVCSGHYKFRPDINSNRKYIKPIQINRAYKLHVTRHTMAEEKQVDKHKFPLFIGFILSNEAAERFTYYAMRTILVTFLTGFVGFDDDLSTVIYHIFTVWVYLTPILGAALADGWFGKYRIIVWFSLLYLGGIAFTVVSSIPQLSPETSVIKTVNGVLYILGLMIIGLGAGGIKPCVSAHGADQFHPEDDRNKATFFMIFYFSINFGSLISTFISPLLRKLTCGSLGTTDSCYFLAFGVPFIVMGIAIIAFIIGKRWYVNQPPTGRNIFWEVLKCICIAPFKKVPEHQKEKGNTHWLYGASGYVEDWIIRDSKYVFRVLVVFLPLPIFWAAFDQQGSRWTLQAYRMNGWLSTSMHILPDQVQFLNAFLVLFFIPIFRISYALIDKIAGRKVVNPTRKMTVGSLLALTAYVAAALVQTKMEKTLTKAPELSNEVSFRVINAFTKDTISGKFDYNGEVVEFYADYLNESFVSDTEQKTLSSVFNTQLCKKLKFIIYFINITTHANKTSCNY